MSALEPEFYPIKRVLIAGPLADAAALADRAAASGHAAVLLLREFEQTEAPDRFPVLNPDAEDNGVFDLAIELHCEDFGGKSETLWAIEELIPPTTPLMTLCNALPLGEIAMHLTHPRRTIGVCLLRPYAEAKIAELIHFSHTDLTAVHIARRFCESVGLPAMDIQDSAGGVLVRTVCCLVNEAALAEQDRIATGQEIDTAMKLGVNYPNGPLEWGRKIGLDHVLAVMEGLHAEFKEERYRAAPALKRLVREQHAFH